MDDMHSAIRLPNNSNDIQYSGFTIGGSDIILLAMSTIPAATFFTRLLLPVITSFTWYGVSAFAIVSIFAFCNILFAAVTQLKSKRRVRSQISVVRWSSFESINFWYCSRVMAILKLSVAGLTSIWFFSVHLPETS